MKLNIRVCIGSKKLKKEKATNGREPKENMCGEYVNCAEIGEVPGITLCDPIRS